MSRWSLVLHLPCGGPGVGQLKQRLAARQVLVHADLLAVDLEAVDVVEEGRGGAPARRPVGGQEHVDAQLDALLLRRRTTLEHVPGQG